MGVRAIVVWLLLLVLAVASGFFPRSLLVPQMGAGAGRVVSTLLLSALMIGATWLTNRG